MKKIDTACIIDDDEIYIFAVKRLIQKNDFCNNVIVYNNGKDALEKIKHLISSNENLPDVILLDINMPIMDGWQFLDEFTSIKTEKEITIYMVSSSINPTDVERAKSYKRVSNYIVKPISGEDLCEIKRSFAA
ncbi:MAG: response regulator [Flavobacteriaceae bacterium]|uniref:response regulator n=1 Tax=Winogradskyella sp. SYSU M77433 TaxID=3042722 RepID=UPI000C54D7D3|nr:response regulator [Winogradskyella sp. SYSU M77433]MAX70468.1 response regulator [Flavobacteriaceae bacterium]MDH7911199.1 response regulator [Winogradskyella sp. SYSU M77433]|tara:strand:+ start:848 stop:1246 length:399 start_codon:yes stop_codon:yes gene_type:complete